MKQIYSSIYRNMVLVAVLLLTCQILQGQPDYQALSYERYQQGRYQESIDAARSALKTDSKAAWAYNNIAVSLLGLKKYDEAIANAEHALMVQPGFILAVNNLAWIRDEKAKASGFGPLPKSAAATPESYIEQSFKAYASGQFQDCITAANEALRLRPGYADAYNNIGACSASLSRWDDAIRNEREAIRLQPDYPMAKNNLTYAMQQKAAKKQ